MRILAWTRASAGLACVSLLLAAAPAPGQAAGTEQERKLTLEEKDTMAAVLGRLEGKSVRLRLAGSGEEVAGRLQKVGKELVHVSELSGRDFFDAVVRIDQVAAVSVQVRGR